MSWFHVSRRFRNSTTYVVRDRKGKKREYRRTAFAVPFVGRSRHKPPMSAGMQLVWYALPGLLLSIASIGNVNKWAAIDIVDLLLFGTSLVLVVRAWVGTDRWSLRVVCVAASLGYPLFWFLRNTLS